MNPGSNSRARRRVVMLVAKGISHDARVRRSARSLAAHGYEVTIACKPPNGQRSAVVEEEGYRILFVPIGSVANKRSLHQVRAERRQLLSELQGKPPSPSDRDRIAELKRVETTLRRRYQSLSGLGERSVFVDKPYLRAWSDFLRQERPDVIHVHDHQ